MSFYEFAPVVASPRFRSVDRSFERFVNRAVETKNRQNVEQDDKTWTISLDAPGVSREELNIGIEGAVVRIETTAEARRKYKAAYELPLEIDAANSSAKLENGVLTLTLGKLLPVSKVTALEVK